MLKLEKIYRLLKLFYIKLLRTEGTAHSIALAIALGLFIGCLVPIGFQTIIVIILAFLLRANKILAFAATWITNPYTVTFLYPIFCYTGGKILGIHLTFASIEKDIITIIKTPTIHTFFNMGHDIILSYIAGATFYGIITGVAGYIITYKIVFNHKKKKRLRQKLKKIPHA